MKWQKYLSWKLQLAGVMSATKLTWPAVVTTVTVEAQVLPLVVDPPKLEAATAQAVVEDALPELVAEPSSRRLCPLRIARRTVSGQLGTWYEVPV